MTGPQFSSRTNVSVIMPVYNTREFLPEALQSVLSQSHEHFELIAIDDGSTDGSVEVLADFARRDPRIRFYHRDNRGVAATANECLEKAKHELVVRIDADDLMTVNRLERQIWFMQKYQEFSVATSYAWLIDRKGNLLARAMPEIDMDRGIRESDPIRFVQLIQPATIMRKSHILTVGGYSNEYRFAEDRELWGRLVAAGFRLGVQPEFLLKQRLHGASLTASSGRRNLVTCKFIDQNIVRTLQGEPRISFEEYLDSRNRNSLLKRIARSANESSSVFYVQATRDYAERKWLRFLVRSASAVCLNPMYGVRMLQRVSGAQRSME